MKFQSKRLIVSAIATGLDEGLNTVAAVEQSAETDERSQVIMILLGSIMQQLDALLIYDECTCGQSVRPNVTQVSDTEADMLSTQ